MRGSIKFWLVVRGDGLFYAEGLGWTSWLSRAVLYHDQSTAEATAENIAEFDEEGGPFTTKKFVAIPALKYP